MVLSLGPTIFREPVDFSFTDLHVLEPALGPKLHTILELCSQDTELYFLTDRLWNYMKEFKAKHRARGNGFGNKLVEGEEVTATQSARYYKEGIENLIDK